MAHIKDERDVLERIKAHLAYFQKLGFNYETLTSFLREFIPQTQAPAQRISYNVLSFEKKPVGYDLVDREVRVSIPGLNEHVVKNVDDLAEIFHVKDKQELCYYLALFSILAQIEKSYEQLMGEGVLIAPSNNVQIGYQEIFSLLDPRTSEELGTIKRAQRTRSAKLYDKEFAIHIIDRNANLQAANLMKDVAASNNRQQIASTFGAMSDHFAKIGYHRDRRGCFDHTFRDIGYKQGLALMDPAEDSQLPINERIENGLSIPEETRKLVLARKGLKR